MTDEEFLLAINTMRNEQNRYFERRKRIPIRPVMAAQKIVQQELERRAAAASVLLVNPNWASELGKVPE